MMLQSYQTLPLLANTTLPGVHICTDTEGLLGAIASGAKHILAGRSVQELSTMLPIKNNTDVLQIVAEGRILHGDKMAVELAHALFLRVQLLPDAKPILKLALVEFLQNAIEHGNLGLSMTRQQQVDDFAWFEAYHSGLNNALQGPLGRIPVRVTCRMSEGLLRIEIEDRGMGFPVRETLQKLAQPGQATGRGLGLLQKLLGSQLSFDAGGRVVRFALPLEQTDVKSAPKALRLQSHIVAWGSSPSRQLLLERTLRSAGCQSLETLHTLKGLSEHIGHARLLVLDAYTPNFATIAYALADVQKEHPKLPIMLWAPRAVEAALKLALNTPCMDVFVNGLTTGELELRLERILQTGEALHRERRMESTQREEVERTRSFQTDMMPKAGALAVLATKHKIQIGTSYQGCETLAGDYWSVAEVGPHHVALAMMDFTGHGVRAALNTVQLHALLKNEWNAADSVGIAASLNASLHGLLGPGCFAAYVYGVLDTKNGSFSYCAGGAPPLLVKSQLGVVRELGASGLPLGLTPRLLPALRTAQLEEGETLLIYSDALTDAPHRNGKRWEQAGLKKAWKGIPSGMLARNAVQALLEKFHSTVVLPMPDDLTVLAVKR
jgi:sigma-B regulation protein RsbU (phosphoserine phosphatase)